MKPWPNFKWISYIIALNLNKYLTIGRSECLRLHERQKNSTASRANSAWFCPSSLNTTQPLGSSVAVEGALLYQKKCMQNVQKVFRGIESLLIIIKVEI